MRIVTRVALILGGIVLIASIVFMIMGGFEVWKQFLVLSAGRSKEFENPFYQMLWGAGLAWVSGLLIGLGIGLPKPQRSTAPADPLRPGDPTPASAPPPPEG